MQVFLADTDITVPVPLTRDGEPFTADDNQVSWELRGHDGSVLLAKTTLAGVTGTTAMIPVPAARGQLTAGRIVEKRTVTVTGLADALPFSIRQSYRIIDFLNHTVIPADVRTFVGVDEGELSDNEIDITAAFIDVGDDITLETLTQALAGDQTSDLAANRAIIAKAVLNLLPSLAARVSKSDSDGTSKVERFPIDLNELRVNAQAHYDTQLSIITGVQPAARTFVAASSQVDPLTGA